MRADMYTAFAKAEDSHWWFKARRTIIASLLRGQKLPASTAILDAGCGTGGNLAMLCQFGQLSAMEMDAQAREFSNKRGVVSVEAGKLPHTIPFGSKIFDLAVMFDVLEHIDEDFDTLVEIHKRLSEHGTLMLTVPAFKILWSMHDDINHHKRRYRLKALVRLVESAGFKVSFASYINFWLFPIIAVARIFDRLTGGYIIGGKPDANVELAVPPAIINRILETIFSSESAVLKIMPLPFGVSIVLLAQKV